MLTRIGIIGYGGFGQFLHASWSEMPQVRLVAVADEIADRNPGGKIRFYSSWTKLIEDKEVDIVWIATPPQTHAEIACAAMQAGRDVVVEKPMATNITDANQILEVHKQTKRIITVDYMLRFDPICQTLATLTAERVFGELRHVNVENYAQDQGLPIQHWFWNKQISGGILVEHAVHFIDLVHYFSDQNFTKVNGLTFNRNSQQEDQVFAGILYDKGLIATHYHSFARPGFFEQTSIRLNYDLADIDIQGWIPLSGSFRVLVNRETAKRLEQLPGLIIEKQVPASDVKDLSRPKGWGNTKAVSSTEKTEIIHSGGKEYTVDQMLQGHFSVTQTKQQVYTNCVRALLQDVITKRQNPEHKLRVNIANGLSSLTVALMASNS